MRTFVFHGLLLIACLAICLVALPKSGNTWIPVGILIFAFAEGLRTFFKRNIRTRTDEKRPPKY